LSQNFNSVIRSNSSKSHDNDIFEIKIPTRDEKPKINPHAFSSYVNGNQKIDELSHHQFKSVSESIFHGKQNERQSLIKNDQVKKEPNDYSSMFSRSDET
jgi:hypothetical protein